MANARCSYIGRPASKFDGDLVRVELTQRPASCKPRDRWLEQQNAQSSCLHFTRCKTNE